VTQRLGKRGRFETGSGSVKFFLEKSI